MATSITGDGIVFPDSTIQYTGASPYCRNRIINGRMAIDQRNAGALVTYQITGFPTGATNGYFIDRFVVRNLRTNGGLLTAQQITDVPAGYGLTHCASITNETGGATATGDVMFFRQQIEGLHTGDLQWGTATAETCTLSFWVKSSVTGTYAVSFRNSAGTDVYVATYIINAANTWEYKTITIPGPTTGVWDITTNAGIVISWDLGVGSTYEAPVANAWTTGNYNTVAGTIKISNTTGANIRFTGVQFELGSRATSLEDTPYPIELSRCERYYSINAGNLRGYSSVANGVLECWIKWRRPMRTATPTIVRVAGTMTNATAATGSQGANQYGMRHAVISTAAGITGEAGGVYRAEAEL